MDTVNPGDVHKALANAGEASGSGGSAAPPAQPASAALAAAAPGDPQAGKKRCAEAEAQAEEVVKPVTRTIAEMRKHWITRQFPGMPEVVGLPTSHVFMRWSDFLFG